MKLLPALSFTVLTKLPTEEVISLIYPRIDPSDLPGWRLTMQKLDVSREYAGQVQGNRFIMSPVTAKGGAYPLVITGDVSKDIAYTAVRIDMKFYPGAPLLIIIFTVLLPLTFLLLTVDHFPLFQIGGMNIRLWIVFPFLSALFWIISFRMQVNRTKKFLCRLLQGWEEGSQVL